MSGQPSNQPSQRSNRQPAICEVKDSAHGQWAKNLQDVELPAEYLTEWVGLVKATVLSPAQSFITDQ